MTYTPKLKPYDHQEKGVDKCNGAAAFAYLAEMGCVDALTEYLGPGGWRRIDCYDGGEVAQYELDGSVRFVVPDAYVRKPVDQFFHFKSSDCDQVLSLDHRILLRDEELDSWAETSPRALLLEESGSRRKFPAGINGWPGDGPPPTGFVALGSSYKILPEPLPYTSEDGLMYCFKVPSSYLVFRRNGCVFASGNTGKSCMLQYDWGRLHEANEVDDMLLIAPAGVYRNWEKELRDHLDEDVYDRARIFTWKAGGGVTFKNDLSRFVTTPDRRRPRFFLVNSESYGTQTGLAQATKQFLTGHRALTGVDESTLMKNHQAKRTQEIVKLKYMSPYRRILAGLPNPKSPLDLFSQFEFLDRRILGHETFYSYRAQYAVMQRIDIRGPGGALVLNKDGTPKKRPEVTGYRNLEELKARVNAASYRVLKDDCLDLPPKIYMPLREVKLHPEQKRVYDEVKKNATAMLSDGSHVTTAQVITQLLRLQQILCGHVVDEEGRVHDLPEHRTDALLEDLDAVGGKAIIWTVYRRSIEQIAERVRKEYGPRSIVTYFGDTSSDDRTEAITRFQNDNECLFFLSNQQTGGRGITLTEAKGVIYHSNSPDLELRLQSEDRPHRVGLKHPVAYSDLHVPGTIDERWVKTLRKKMDLASAVLGDGHKTWLI